MPKNIVEANRNSSNINSALTFLVPVITILSTILAGLVGYHSSGDSGIASNPNFWRLIESCIIQILSAETLILPAIFNMRLAEIT